MYSFDTGASAPIATLLGQGYIELLTDLEWTEDSVATTRGPYLRTLQQIPWSPDPVYVHDRIKEIIESLPGVLIQVGEAQVTHLLANVIRWEYAVMVHVISGQDDSLVEGRLDLSDYNIDTRQDPGVRVILDHAVENLYRQTIETCPGSGPIKPVTIKHIATTPEFSWFVIGTTIDVQQFISPDRDAVPLDEIHVKHDIQESNATIEENVKVLTP